jgi:DNA helicase TIP49 (TBP-interacting protein)
MCDVLYEMREAYKTRNFSYLKGLIEEAQTYANRMEAKLEQVKDIEKLDERWHDAKEKEKILNKEEKE